jgi:hypothetical protein
MRRVLIITLAVSVLAGCKMQDVDTPVPQADTVVYGRVSAVRQTSSEPAEWQVEVKGGLPQALKEIMQREGRPVPELESTVTVVVKVTPETVCVADLRPASLQRFRVGEEVAAIPVPGTSAMVGSKKLLLDAAELYEFKSYQVRFLPRSMEALPPGVGDRSDPARINSSGLERTPLPLREGHVVYFAAGLLPTLAPGGQPRGAVRPGMRAGDGLAPWAVGGYRPYRVDWGGSGWKTPEPVVLKSLPDTASAAVTWVNADETALLVEVRQQGEPARLITASRANDRAPWGALKGVGEARGGSVGDGQRFGKNATALVWTVYGPGGSDLWLAMGGKPGQPLEPKINTLGAEWAPRVGPHTILFFCRGERQLLYAGGRVQEVRLDGPQRLPFLEAAPSEGGTLLFFRYPAVYGPGQPDDDIAVAKGGDASWGAPVPLDDWRPVS